MTRLNTFLKAVIRALVAINMRKLKTDYNGRLSYEYKETI